MVVSLPIVSTVKGGRTKTTAFPFVLGDFGSDGSRTLILGGGLATSGGGTTEMGRGRMGSLAGRSVEWDRGWILGCWG
jgi:hypothetical protein